MGFVLAAPVEMSKQADDLQRLAETYTQRMGSIPVMPTDKRTHVVCEDAVVPHVPSEAQPVEADELVTLQDDIGIHRGGLDAKVTGRVHDRGETERDAFACAKVLFARPRRPLAHAALEFKADGLALSKNAIYARERLVELDALVDPEHYRLDAAPVHRTLELVTATERSQLNEALGKLFVASYFARDEWVPRSERMPLPVIAHISPAVASLSMEITACSGVTLGSRGSLALSDSARTEAEWGPWLMGRSARDTHGWYVEGSPR